MLHLRPMNWKLTEGSKRKSTILIKQFPRKCAADSPAAGEPAVFPSTGYTALSVFYYVSKRDSR